MTNKNNTTLYTGVTNSLTRRAYEHSIGAGNNERFTKRYHITKLIWYEEYRDVRDAIAREKQLKAGSRRKKIRLVESINPQWRNLYDEILL